MLGFKGVLRGSALVVLTLATGCFSNPPQPPADLPIVTEPASLEPTPPPDVEAPRVWTNSPQELDVLEAVFRYQLMHNESAGNSEGGHVDYYFLALGEGGLQMDPTTELMSRFLNHSPAVAPVSSAESDDYYTHKDHGGHGVLLYINGIRQIDADTLDVYGGYYEGVLSSSSNTYRVHRCGDSWQVEADELVDIS